MWYSGSPHGFTTNTLFWFYIKPIRICIAHSPTHTNWIAKFIHSKTVESSSWIWDMFNLFINRLNLLPVTDLYSEQFGCVNQLRILLFLLSMHNSSGRAILNYTKGSFSKSITNPDTSPSSSMTVLIQQIILLPISLYSHYSGYVANAYSSSDPESTNLNRHDLTGLWKNSQACHHLTYGSRLVHA